MNNEMPGFNRDLAEYSGAREYAPAEEVRSFAGNPEAEEGNDGARRKKKRENRSRERMTGLASFFVAAAVVVTAGAVLLSTPDVDAEIVAEATDVAVTYEISVSSESALNVVLYNDFTRRSSPLGEGVTRGVFEGLRPGVEYTLAVVGNFGFGERRLAEQKIKTSAFPAHVPVTEWRGVEHECKCYLDGYFYFRMDFLDENNYYSDFEATLTDIDGNVSRCVFGEDIHAFQRIDVAGKAALVGNRAVFRIACHTSENGGESLVLYEATVKI